MSKHQDLKICALKLNKYEFQSLEVVGHDSETQLQVGENLNKSTQQDKSYPAKLPYSTCHPFEVMSRNRDRQIHVDGNYSYLLNFLPNICACI